MVGKLPPVGSAGRRGEEQALLEMKARGGPGSVRIVAKRSQEGRKLPLRTADSRAWEPSNGSESSNVPF